MCIPSTPSFDNSAAEEERRRAEEREARIRTGSTEIDKAFVGFNDPYYQGIEKAALDFYTPDLDDQYARTRKQAVLSLGRTGNLQSSAAASTLGDILGDYNRAKVMVADRARGFAQQRRGDVESARTDLMSQLRASADPAFAATSAVNRAAALLPPPSFDPLGDVFLKATAGLANIRGAEERGTAPTGARLFGLGGRGTGRTIN